MKTRLTAWEPHPVTPSRKAELARAGFRIVDAAFAPPPEELQTVRAVSGDETGGGPLAVISKSDFNPELHAVHDPEAEAAAAAEQQRLQAEAEAAQKAEAERQAALQQPEAAQAVEAAPTPAPAAAPRARGKQPTTEA